MDRCLTGISSAGGGLSKGLWVIRGWRAGCGTGQAVISLAVCLVPNTAEDRIVSHLHVVSDCEPGNTELIAG